MKLSQLISSLGKLVGYGLCRLLPIEWVSNLGARRGRYSPVKEHALRPLLIRNLQYIGSTDTQVAVDALKKESGRAFLEMLIGDRIVRAGRVNWAPNDDLDQAIQQQRPLIFCSVHLSNLGDVLGASLVKEIATKMPGYRMGISTMYLNDPVDRWIATRSRRLSFGRQQGWVTGPRTGLARQMLRELLHPPSLLLLHIDESRKHQVHCPSFGRVLPQGINLRYAVKLAMRTKACLVPVYLLRDPDAPAHFTVHTIRVMDFNSIAVDEQDAIQTIDQDFEQIVRRYPERWLQMYHARLRSD